MTPPTRGGGLFAELDPPGGGQARDVQLSAFPDFAPDRPVGAILGSVFTGSNADLMSAVAPLYLTGSVLDVTYGRGRWWRRFQPDPFTFHDMIIDGVDFGNLPDSDHSFDTVCFDPPYVPTGGLTAISERVGSPTQRAQEFRNAFGQVPCNKSDIIELVTAGMAECARVARTWVLAKCCDYVSSGLHLGHIDMLNAARANGLICHDLIVHHTGPGPGGHNIFTPLRARRAHSYLLVFKVPAGVETAA